MKIKIFSFLLLSLTFIGCTTEQSINPQETSDLKIDQTQHRFGGDSWAENCATIPCVSNYVYLTQIGGQFHYQVHYDTSLTLQEVECKRQKFFNCFENLRMSILQPSNPYQDSWVATDGKPHTSITNAICTDPETGLTIECQ